MVIQLQETKDFFSRSEIFLTAFNKVLTRGFFEEFETSTRTPEKGHFILTLKAKGKIPDHTKDNRPGLDPLRDVADIFGRIRTQINSKHIEIRDQRGNVAPSDWHKLDRGGKQGFDRLGLEYNFEFKIDWIVKRKPRQRKNKTEAT